jgi:long-chain acyl-CoA synthetase
MSAAGPSQGTLPPPGERRVAALGGSPPSNLAGLFAQHLVRPQTVLYRHHAAGAWRDVTAAELAALVARWQAAFRRERLAPGARIALCARNGVDWVAIDLAALGLGLVVVPLYVDDNPDSIGWCVANADAALAIVENVCLAHGLRKALASGAPPIVVLHAEEALASASGVTPAERFVPPAAVEPPEVRFVPAEALATICYTSGTAGRPKGVMLSHGNIAANVASCRATGMARASDRFFSVLPLSHMFERTGGYYLPLALGVPVVFGRGIVHVADDLATQQPTVMFAVPRILERFDARIAQQLARSPLKRALVARCVRLGVRAADGNASPLERVLLEAMRAVVARPILAHLGGRLRLVVVGGAPLDPALARRFIGLGLPVLQGYGMTEASPVVAVNRLDDNVPESVGPPLPGVEAQVRDDGELVVRGASVMLGYWRNEAATKAAVDAAGWLHTGDLAEIRGGRIYIRGRSKDVLVMSNGEKLSPQDAELAVLRDPLFEQAMIIGEGRPYPVLLAVSRETDEKALLQRANAQLAGFPRWARVRRVVAMREPWNVESGLLTPTLKLRRGLIAARFADRIDAAYAAAE